MDLQKMIQETFPLYEDMDDMEVAQTIWRRRGAEILGERLNQQLIDKACDTIKHLLGGYVIRNFNFGDSYDMDELIDDFKKAMKGE